MKSWKRLFFYLTLNVLVSACTTLAVLFAWDQMQGPVPRGLLPVAFNRLSSPEETPAPLETPAGNPEPQPTSTEMVIVYQVQPGDTFESIAAQHNISVQTLVTANGFTRSQPLGAGEVLRIPQRPAGSVVIDSVIGASDLDAERVLLKHSGAGELSLVGWRLEDDQGNIFLFPQSPQLILFPGGAVNIYTRSGVNTVVDLYWGLDKPVWSSGSTVILRDAQGNVHTRYKVP
jgi:LysM repeat protein